MPALLDSGSLAPLSLSETAVLCSAGELAVLLLLMQRLSPQTLLCLSPRPFVDKGGGVPTVGSSSASLLGISDVVSLCLPETLRIPSSDVESAQTLPD